MPPFHRSGEASGLIDVHTLATLGRAAALARPAPTQSDLSATLLVAPRVRVAVWSEQGPLIALLGLLTSAVLGLGAFVLQTTPPASEAAPLAVRLPDEPAQQSLHALRRVPDGARVQVATPAEPEAPRFAARARAKARPAAAAVASLPAAPRSDSVTCLLDPSACPRAPRSAAPPVSVGAADPELPATLELADVQAGVRAAKQAALDRCRAHARGGEVLRVRLSIAGPTGEVVATEAAAEPANPALADCSAAELARARFKAVAKARVGTVVTLKF